MSERLAAALHAHDQETIRKYREEIVPALEKRIKELEYELELVPCVKCSGMSREQWEALS